MSLRYSLVNLSSRTQVEALVDGAPALYDERAYPAADGTYNLAVAYECRWLRAMPTRSGWGPAWVRVDANGCDAVWSWKIVNGFWVTVRGEEDMPLWVAETVDRLRPVGHAVSLPPRAL